MKKSFGFLGLVGLLNSCRPVAIINVATTSGEIPMSCERLLTTPDHSTESYDIRYSGLNLSNELVIQYYQDSFRETLTIENYSSSGREFPFRVDLSSANSAIGQCKSIFYGWE